MATAMDEILSLPNVKAYITCGFEKEGPETYRRLELAGPAALQQDVIEAAGNDGWTVVKNEVRCLIVLEKRP